jgi:hypothetical protein
MRNSCSGFAANWQGFSTTAPPHTPWQGFAGRLGLSPGAFRGSSAEDSWQWQQHFADGSICSAWQHPTRPLAHHMGQATIAAINNRETAR